ncbi:hypothetical protein ACKWTF_016410 [Chironomus riparius]
MESRLLSIKSFRRFYARTNENSEQRNDIQLEEYPNDKNINPSTTSTDATNSFLSVESLSTLFEIPDAILKKPSKVLLFRIEIELPSDQLTSTELEEITQKCLKNSVVLLISSKHCKDFTIIWKSREISHFLTLKLYNQCKFLNDLRLFEFVAKFLTNSLKHGHLGLHNAVIVDQTSAMFELHLLADHRNYNLLLIAAELGDIFNVNLFLDGGFNTESYDTNAQTLAYENQHFSILFSLLKSNLVYPQKINIQECPADIKSFYEISFCLHEAIKLKHSQKILEILNQNTEIRHFYDLSNNSAPAVALKYKRWDMYSLLVSKNIMLGPHEKFSEIKRKMKDSELEEIREIHFKESKFLPDNHMHVLLSNSRLAPGTTQHTKKYEIIQKAFEILNQNPLIQIILMVVAVSRNFRIVFDFDQYSIEHIDPTADASSKGIFYSFGRIYIAAKQLTNPNTMFDALGTLAHELCHYAMNLVYNNMARPYLSNDDETEKELDEISRGCEENQHKEEIIKWVYECYQVNMQHAELIVRVPHIVMKYFEQTEKFEETRQNFCKLFKIYEEKIVEQLKKALPEIEAKVEIENQSNRKKIRKLTLISIFVGLLAIIGIVSGIIIGLVLHTPTYKFNELTFDQKMTVYNAQIKYKNVNLIMSDLFPQNSTVYEQLTSEHILKMLNGNLMDFADPHLLYLAEHVTHKWENLTEKLRKVILNSIFIFQNEALEFKDLHDINTKVFNYLTSKQIVDILDGIQLVVHNMIQFDTKFYEDRKFWNEYIREIYFHFMNRVQSKRYYSCPFYNNTGYNKTFETFHDEFLSQNFSVQLSKIKKLKFEVRNDKCANLEFKINSATKPYNVTDTLVSHKTLQMSFIDIFNLTNFARFFILSAEAGTGKTVTFKHLTMKIKNIFPTRWVSYIDLKDYKHLYKGIKTMEDIKIMFMTIFKLYSSNEFEKKIFEIFFESKNLTLFWDGFDEISPEFSDDMMNILTLLKEFGIIQFVCTRPLYSDQLVATFSVHSYTLMSFDENEQDNFIIKVLDSENAQVKDKSIYLAKVKKIFTANQLNKGFETPLMLHMITHLISKNVEIFENENLFEIYQKFTDEKFEVWKNKSEFAIKFYNTLIKTGFNLYKLHQAYALRSELPNSYEKFGYFNSLKLKVMRQKIPEELTKDEISRIGILYINDKKTFNFAHRTFAEFFISQYFIENIHDVSDEPTNAELEQRLVVFRYSLGNFGMRIFLKQYLKTEKAKRSSPFSSQLLRIFNSRFKYYFNNFVGYYDEFALILNFFEKDPKLLKSLLLIDQDETLYTSLFNYVHIKNFMPHKLKIKDFVVPYLTKIEYDKFINGNDQKGVILFGSYCLYKKRFRNNVTHDKYILDDKLMQNDDAFYVLKTIVESLNSNEIQSFLKSGVIFNKIVNRNYDIFNDTMWNFIDENLKLFDEKQILLEMLENSKLSEVFGANTNIFKNSQKFFMEKFSRIFRTDEIYEVFVEYNVLYYLIANPNDFQLYWTFFTNRTTLEQQKTMLTRSRACAFEFCDPYPILFEAFMEYQDFVYIPSIYDQYFLKAQLQKFVISQKNEFLLYLTFTCDKTKLLYFAKFLQNTFIGQEKKLNSFLLQNIEPINQNVFEMTSKYNFANEQNLAVLTNLLNNSIDDNIPQFQELDLCTRQNHFFSIMHLKRQN